MTSHLPSDAPTEDAQPAPVSDAPPKRNPPVGYALTVDAAPSSAPWAKLLSWESLRYHGSGWWLDASMPRSPIGLLVFAVVLPVAWYCMGLALTSDRSSYNETADIKFQLPFAALHILCLRLAGTLWARGLGPALTGLGIPSSRQQLVRRGVLGPWANLGAAISAAYYIGRDTYMAVVPNPETGFTAYTDPELWDFGALGDNIRPMLLSLWDYEWLIYGHLFWLHLWCLVSLTFALRTTDYRPHLERILLRDEYRDFFTLLGTTATISSLFALGNLGFIHVTGELFPREAVKITGVASFITEMSDLLSTALLFFLIVFGFVVYLKVLRGALSETVNTMFAEEGTVSLEALSSPLTLTGDASVDAENLRRRVEAQAGLVRAIAFQREVDAMGERSLSGILLKAAPALLTVMRRLGKIKVGSP